MEPEVTCTTAQMAVCTALAYGGTVAALPFLIGAMGFTAAGVAAGSIAAAIQGPTTAAGSLFAILQSLGAAGVGVGGKAAIGGVSTTACAALFSYLKCGKATCTDEYDKYKITGVEVTSIPEILIFHGLPERADENTEALIKDFIDKKLLLRSSTIEFKSVIRIGKEDSRKRRSIAAKFLRFEDREIVKLTVDAYLSDIKTTNDEDARK